MSALAPSAALIARPAGMRRSSARRSAVSVRASGDKKSFLDLKGAHTGLYSLVCSTGTWCRGSGATRGVLASPSGLDSVPSDGNPQACVVCATAPANRGVLIALARGAVLPSRVPTTLWCHSGAGRLQPGEKESLPTCPLSRASTPAGASLQPPSCPR